MTFSTIMSLLVVSLMQALNKPSVRQPLSKGAAFSHLQLKAFVSDSISGGGYQGRESILLYPEESLSQLSSTFDDISGLD